jgi:hypothetical protein
MVVGVHQQVDQVVKKTSALRRLLFSPLPVGFQVFRLAWGLLAPGAANLIIR